jgi:uncharacterized membrane protein
MIEVDMKNTRYLVQAAIIAAIYASLTIVLMPLSYGVMQVRVSEALTILPAFTPAAIPGLFVGCLVANIVGPYGVMDMVLGSIATLLAALCSYRLRDRQWLVPLPPVIANGLIIGAMLHYAYGLPVSLPACILWVALGEALACYGIGFPLMKYLNKRKTLFRL